MPHHAVLIPTSCTIEEALTLYPFAALGELFVVPETDFGIGEVRALIEEASRRPREGEQRLLVVRVFALTSEAQQALLKLLEEPPRGTAFLFLIPPEIALLPTLRSRFFTVALPGSESVVDTEVFAAFLAAPLATRLEDITKRLAKKDTAWVEAIGRGLARYVGGLPLSYPAPERKALRFVLDRLSTRGASNKLLLEELALSLPSGTGTGMNGTL